MAQQNQKNSLGLITAILISCIILSQPLNAQDNQRKIDFPDIPGYVTLKCDLHMHTVFSDGSVWPDIRVQEALRDGLDAISITDHLEYQPKKDDIPNIDRNRSYQLAKKAANGKDLIIINGAEITRKMPPGHANAIFVEDVNKLNVEDYMTAFEEAKKQGAFVFWNHPAWLSQQPNGVATLHDIHLKLMSEGYISGVEIYNGSYSDEALDIAHKYNLTLLGNSDVHGLIDYQNDIPHGGHRAVTLAFAEEKSEQSLKEAFQQRRTVVWFDNTLVGNAEYLAPLVKNSLEITRLGEDLVQTLMIHNNSDADYIFENLSEYTLQNQASVFILHSHETKKIMVKTIEKLASFNLTMRVMNTITAPGQHAEISIFIE